MLVELHIESMGVIDSLDLVLGRGLTVLTGETGAGKTMLVEAIGLLLGDRADPTIVRAGAQEARIEGRFLDDDQEYVVARVVPADGRSRAYVNGRLVTIAQLADLAARFVDLHGQNAHQSLLTAPEQRRALDTFGDVALNGLIEARQRLTEIEAALASMGGDSRGRAREIDLLTFQHRELAEANLDDPDEEGRLDQVEDVLAGAVEYRQAASEAVEMLAGDGGVIEAAGAAVHRLQAAPPFESSTSRLRAVLAELGDVASGLRSAAETIEEDPHKLDEVRGRRQRLVELRRKYGDSLAEIIAFAADVRQRLEDLHSFDARVALLEQDRTVAVSVLAVEASMVAEQRRDAAAGLATAVQTEVRRLAMPHAAVDVTVGDQDPGDDVTFLLSANPGSALLPMSKVASGGELARMMLALRLVLTEAPDTLLFDEVDAGIGGAAAAAVAQALAELAARHQVLVVTHLAQVAAAADSQIAITKTVTGAKTSTTALRVCGEQRIDEVARMLSGEASLASARQHAADLLSRSAARSSPTGASGAAAG